MKLVNYWDKYAEMHGQQNVKAASIVLYWTDNYRKLQLNKYEEMMLSKV